MPTTLNVLSILMFLRFGFILGQSGIVGTLGISNFHLVYPLNYANVLVFVGMLAAR